MLLRMLPLPVQRLRSRCPWRACFGRHVMKQKIYSTSNREQRKLLPTAVESIVLPHGQLQALAQRMDPVLNTGRRILWPYAYLLMDKTVRSHSASGKWKQAVKLPKTLMCPRSVFESCKHSTARGLRRQKLDVSRIPRLQRASGRWKPKFACEILAGAKVESHER